MIYDILQYEIAYHNARENPVKVVDNGVDSHWLENSYGYNETFITYNDHAAFILMKNMCINIEFFLDRVEAMAADGTSPVSVYYAEKGHLSNREVVNFAILLAATEKLNHTKQQARNK